MHMGHQVFDSFNQEIGEYACSDFDEALSTVYLISLS